MSDQTTVKIGILTQPSRFEDKTYQNGYQYIVSSYIQYLEQSCDENTNIECIPIPFDASKKTLTKIFEGLNGLFFTGGMLNLRKHEQPLSEMTQKGRNVFLNSAYHLFKLALDQNDKGIHFPVWGTCQGFQLLQILVNDLKHSTLTNIENEFIKYHSLQNVDKEGKMFENIDDELIEHIEENDELFYYHEWCVTSKTYKKSEKLQDFFNITAMSESEDGVKFIAAIEAKDYPVYGVQFHPEIPQFEHKISKKNTQESKQFGQELSQFFIQETIENQQQQEQKYELNQQLSNMFTIDLEAQQSLMPKQCFKNIVFFNSNSLNQCYKEEFENNNINEVSLNNNNMLNQSLTFDSIIINRQNIRQSNESFQGNSSINLSSQQQSSEQENQQQIQIMQGNNMMQSQILTQNPKFKNELVQKYKKKQLQGDICCCCDCYQNSIDQQNQEILQQSCIF